MKRKAVFLVLLTLFSVIFCHGQNAQKSGLDKNYEFVNGNWFDGKRFHRKMFYAVDGFLTPKKPLQIDETIDLQNGFVIPQLVPAIVQKAHQADLRVSVAVNSAQDYQVAIASGADEITHLPCYQSVDQGGKCGIDEKDAQTTAKNGVYVSLITSEYEKERETRVIEFDRLNLSLLKSKKVKFVLGSDSYGSTPLNGAIAMSKLNLFSNLQLLKIWVENTPKTIFPSRKIGYLRDGYEASFLVLAENPLLNFEGVRKIKLCFKQGTQLGVGDSTKN